MGQEDEMKLTIFGVLCWLTFGAAAQALTVDEIIRLKQAGVSDSIIEKLIAGDGDARSAGVWKTKDGWIVHTTEIRERRPVDDYSNAPYPLWVTPEVFYGRR
jgi:hypothetical protein